MQPTYDQTDPTSPAGSIPHWIDPVRETDLVARRRTVHRTPETGWAEFIATARAAEFFTSLGFQGIYFAVGLGAVGCAALYYLLYARRRDARAAAAEGEMTEEELEAELEEA